MDAEAPARWSDEDPVPVKKSEEGLVVGIFTTTPDDLALPHTRSDLTTFVRGSAEVAQSHGARVILRDKLDFKRLRGDSVLNRQVVDAAMILEEMRSDERPDIVKIEDPGDRRGIRAEDIYPLIDIGLVFSISTVAFALLALKKKVLVYYPVEGPDHPFKKHTPILVAGDLSELREHFDQLNSMDDAEYEAYIRPTIEWCGCPANGQLVRGFLEEVDRDLWPAQTA